MIKVFFLCIFFLCSTGFAEEFDGLNYSSGQREGLQAYLKVQSSFPRLRSGELEYFLHQLSTEFLRILGPNPIRYRFYLVNTITPTIWPLGGGFLVFHGGLFHLFPEPKSVAFWVTLEMAHEALGHRQIRLQDFKAQSSEIDGWALEVSSDPVLLYRTSYTIEQEMEALSLSRRFLEPMGISVKETSVKLFNRLVDFSNTEKNSLVVLHQNLGKATEALPELIKSSVRWPESKIDLNVEFAFQNRLQHYPWLIQKNSNQLAKKYFNARSLFLKQKWPELLALTSEMVKENAWADPFLDLHAQALQLNERFSECADFLKKTWSFFDYRRELLRAQCIFLDGYATEGASLLRAYRKKYPRDLEGVFWETLVSIKLREEVRISLIEAQGYWGDRPVIRALRAIDYGFARKPTLAKEQFDFVSEIHYTSQENGMFDFSNSWLRRSFSVFQNRDSAGIDYDKQASRLWPVSQVLKLNFPRLN